ncbi:MAG: hypothetical protein OHK005_12820 [Candidatus Methylacidiphilales bacterium]
MSFQDPSPLWQRLFRVGAQPSPASPPAHAEAWKRLLERVRGATQVPPVESGAPVKTEAQSKATPASTQKKEPLPPAPTSTPSQGLTPKAKVIALRSVQLDKEITSRFFRSLIWKRHDPSQPDVPEPEPVEATSQAPNRQTARGFFAYQLPWDHRGGQPTGPVKTDSMRTAPSRSQLPGLAELATQQALASAQAIRRREERSANLSTPDPNHPSIRLFLSNLPWQARTSPQQPDTLTLPA